MKHFFSLFCWVGTSLATLFLLLAAGLPARAQQQEVLQQATQLALQTRAQWAGTDIAAADFRISSAHTEPLGLLYAYPQQLQAGIPVYNRVATLVFKDGKLRHHAGAFLPLMAFAGQPATPKVAALAAVATALATTKAKVSEQPSPTGAASGPEQRQSFAAGGVARRPIEVRLVWATDKGTPRLAWNVNVDLLATPDWLNIRVDATTGQVLGQDNWTVHEKATRPSTAPVRRLVASTGPARAPQALRQPSSAKNTLSVTPASYRVVPFPGERPDVSTPSVDTNPWLRAGASNPATSYGWHFNGTTNYTDTRGNNAWAYDDSLNLDAPGRFTPSMGTASSLVFNDVPDFTKAPTVSKNRRAATTNLFYWNNLMHDVMYQYGFTEASANFQTDNQGRGGLGSDHVLAEAQDGSGTDNANFLTPPEGINGRMQMYLFAGITPPYTITVTAPAAVAGSYTAVEGIVSANNSLTTLGPISGQLAWYTDAGSSTHLACGTAGASLTGKIALINRGSCPFINKIKNAQLAGASAVIIVNNVPGAPYAMSGNDNTITIPAVMIAQADGATLAAQLANGVQVTLPKASPVGPNLDGDFDSGIMAHEYGHGISNRLTGGGANVSCLYHAEEAGEGWSDYLALMMTTDWANTLLTDGLRARPVGTYALGQAPTGAGIRRYPYSTSLSVNPLTYADMAASPEVHDIGEIWCATLWDMTWNIIQMQGSIATNLYNSASTGGNAVALNLVMQGLKLQPCQPGFLDSRDAILAADSLLYNGQYHCAIWGAFARRGMGYSAREGSSTSATDQTAAFDLPGVTLRKNTAIAIGNRFTITIGATCECQTPAPVTIKDQLPTGLQYISSTGGTLSGNTVTFASQSFAQGQRRTYQIVAQTAAGAGCPVGLPVNDDRDANTIGGLTPAVVSGSSAWAATTAAAHTGTKSWRVVPSSLSANSTLTSAAFTPSSFSILSFYQYANLLVYEGEAFDGGRVAISTDNGATWIDAAPYFVKNGYDATFITYSYSPLPGAPCFSGRDYESPTPDLFTETRLNLSSFSGQSIQVRFQLLTNGMYKGTDYGYTGWYLDDIKVLSGCGGFQQIQLLTSSGTVADSYAQPTFLTEPVTLTTWTGAISTDWFTAGNWSAGVPTSSLDAIIPAGAPRYPLVSANTTTRALTLATGATLTHTDGTLDVQGNWTNNGTFVATGGTVQLGATSGSQILGSSTTRFWNLTTTGNPVNLSTPAGLNLQRLLLANTNLNTNGNPVVLESSATGTAMIANPTGVNSLIGTSVTVQRYITPDLNAGAGYRHLSSPTISLSGTESTMFSDLATGSYAPVVNSGYNTAAAPTSVTPFPNIFAYNQARLTSTTNNLGAFDKGWLSPAATSERMTSGFGYTVNIAAGQTVAFKGQPSFGDLSRSLTRNAAGSANATDAGWQLMGNPYPSPYDYSLQAAGDRSNLDAAIYIFESTGPYVGNYRSYINNIGNPILAMGQAFFTRVSTGQTSGTLTFRNANRVTTYANPTYHRPTAETRPLVQLTLAASGSSLADDAYVYFEQSATDGFDAQYDAEKLPNSTGLNLSTSLVGRRLAIDGRAPLGTTQRVLPLAVGVPAPGVYTFTASQLLNLGTVPVYLRDLQLGTLTDLRQQPTYQFTVANAAALNTTRFELVFSPQQALATAPTALAQQVAVYPNPARTQVAIDLPLPLSRQPVQATLLDALGRVVRQQVLPTGVSTHTLPLSGLGSGVYALRLTTDLGQVMQKLVVE